MFAAAFGQFKRRDDLDKFKGYFKVTDGTEDCANAVDVTLYTDEGKKETISVSYNDGESTIRSYGCDYSGYRDGW
jgi:hypothetical protein